MRILAVVAVASASVTRRLRAESLLVAGRRSPSSCLRAAALLEDEDEWLSQCLCAEALNAAMRIETLGNTITIDGPVDTAEHKKVWRTHGPRALKHARRAMALKTNVRTAAAVADAFMFEGSSRGLISQALTGVGTEFVANAKRLVDLDDHYDSGLGYTLLGCYYHLAPWPVGNAGNARRYLQKACDVAPNSRRNHYHLAVVAYRQGARDLARREFQRALRCSPSGNDHDFSDFIALKSREALDILAAA
eukprot:CAMPEP_0197405664 /NCGR_PEP_ID=MMETSP1165-20131217/24684_1 /TAXON_ID=284809 /ORGANISM="Chrysocystis fragilis, Strain CCMP3189" /LENGTH=248 /DNA_ID=CAMNT_0042931989 /DNA_START=27 /DNA_END=773 /DNA_ORIENTATION=+